MTDEKKPLVAAQLLDTVLRGYFLAFDTPTGLASHIHCRNELRAAVSLPLPPAKLTPCLSFRCTTSVLQFTLIVMLVLSILFGPPI